jgi:hypothetical protein
MSRCLPVTSKDIIIGYIIECPACESSHLFYTNLSNPNQNWGFNNNLDKPTFTPSMLIYPSQIQKRCHSFVRDGKIQYLNDCDHDLKGKTVDLPDID